MSPGWMVVSAGKHARVVGIEPVVETPVCQIDRICALVDQRDSLATDPAVVAWLDGVQVHRRLDFGMPT